MACPGVWGCPGMMGHGTSSRYTNNHCRCTRCRLAHNAAVLRARQRRRAKGLCVECLQPTEGGARCEVHRVKHNANVKARRHAEQVAR